ncbi:alpha/beta fold hydrolase [Nocardioides sp. HM23]|uniref:alpha/beta fold hydrolase n=1 Tax=Nocardioides bizhenqiangii TaxID=3095076 RepID=UPI002ACA1F40|nr:alpha/beta fold hydrolase [Nocardioides sp. HM23]MDZ5621367.1 alpha/beta fold hydrolase [Nocardioides sp. HM23]
MSATADQTSVSVSEELLAPLPSGVEICYQTFGDPDADPLLLVMGLGGPMNWWDTGLCTLLAERGFFVIRYDNRDTGRSSRGTGRVKPSMLFRAFVGRRVRAPYSIADLADDAFGLLDHLDIASAHVVGASMGGMIAQTMAIADPDRVRSLTSIMSTTGRRTVGWQSPLLLPILVARRGPDREAYVAGGLKVWQMIGSPGFPPDLEELERRGHETFDRGVSRSGVMRQMIAVLTQRDRTAQLRRLRMPTLVIHGLADKMVHVSGGRSTAMAVPGSELLLIDAMGHDFPKPLYDTIASAVRRTADRATAD